MRIKDGKAKGKAPAKSGAREIVRRELKSVLTSGTIVDGSLLTDDLASHCVAVKVNLVYPFALNLRQLLTCLSLGRNSPRLHLRHPVSEFAFSTQRPPNFPSPLSRMTLAAPNSKR